ncbi:hypothetical protein G3I40_18085 [Streptomyces sp. SID14478]|uniref:hypothetical protein n=1 Tax=Streptomyces sp. SID14478 TaxID=2706073 RepID=UPI0013DD3C28|nr:hypothetical protein [Streptomyces sp. SID14478]NEB77116.1 hypothetical protein [Streptomyces sp. SID14478]
MTQPQQPYPPQDSNPYAQQQPQQQPGYGYPQQQPQQGQPYAPFPQQQGRPGGFVPAPTAPVRSGNVALAVVAAVVVALLAAWIYGAVMKGTKHEIGYAAVAVGALIGFVAGKVGGRSQALPIVCGVLALGAVYLGQLTGFAMAYGEYANVSFVTALTDNFSLINDVWKHEADFMTYLFLVIGGVAAFGSAQRAAR